MPNIGDLMAKFGIGAAGGLLLWLAKTGFSTVSLAPAGVPALAQLPRGESLLVPAVLPTAVATLATAALFYVFLFVQSQAIWPGIAAARAEARQQQRPRPSLYDVKYGQTRHTRRADRTVQNMIEQMPCALLSAWMVTLLVDARLGAQLLWGWLGFRALYPLVFGGPTVFLSTLPGYGIVVYGAVRVAAAAAEAAAAASSAE